MIVRIGIEFVLAIITLIVGSTFWEFPKRARFLKAVISNEQFLLQFITPTTFDSVSPMIRRYAEKSEGGYVVNMGAVTHADRVSQRRLQLLNGAVVLAALVGSYFLGPIYLAVSVAIFLISGIGSISAAARNNALEHVLVLAFILHKWHSEDPSGCEQWIQEAWSLRPLYTVVKLTS